jgi:transcriptional regulator with XRE-family HTH domain
VSIEDRRPPRDEEEAAAFKGLGHAITLIRERQGMTRVELAPKCEMTVPELEAIERGELDEWWGGLLMISKGLDMSLPALLMEAEEAAPGPGGEEWRRISGEAESGSTEVRSDAAERGRRE